MSDEHQKQIGLTQSRKGAKNSLSSINQKQIGLTQSRKGAKNSLFQ